jgi:shikimate 5-dehydrogenase
MMTNQNPQNLRDIIEQGLGTLAQLPADNDFSLEAIDSMDFYTVPLISHDYGAKTPLMWNAAYRKLGIKVANIMLVADPKNAQVILSALKQDPKYLGGGLGVGWKEIGIQSIDSIVPSDLSAVNIVVKNLETNELIGHNTDSAGFVKSLEDKFAEIGKTITGSNIVILGAGGVAGEITKLIAEQKPKRIVILNRSFDKAINLAYEINSKYGKMAMGGGEDITRGYLLNSMWPPDAVINLSDKGSDGPLKEFSAFAIAEMDSEYGIGYNNTMARTIAREMKNLNPNVIVADIVIPKSGRSITLRIAKNEGLKNLLDGIPMVINQGVKAFWLIHQKAMDSQGLDMEELTRVMKDATK